jgi:hypothetical protein
MNRLILILFLVPLISYAEPPAEAEREFSLANEYFDWDAKTLDNYPFTEDLKKIDERISGEYIYSWEIGFPRTQHIIQAACLDNYDKVLAGWWRTKDRAGRVAALAVFYCTATTDNTMSNFPQFARDAMRFKDDEAKERSEEIVFVKTRIPYFKNWLRSLVSDKLPKDSKFLKALGP